MSKSVFSFPTHLSIVWGVTLAIITLVEWNSLDRDPMRKQIYSPFIERRISVLVDEAKAYDGEAPGSASLSAGIPDAALKYKVEFEFNGPMFLVCFFIPVLIFHGAGWLLARINSIGGGP